MDRIVETMASYTEYMDKFNIMGAVNFTRNHLEIPILAVALYLVGVFKLPELLPRKLNVKKAFALWNLALCIFSIFGVYFLATELVRKFFEKGLYYTVCTEPLQWYGNGAPGFWMTAFIFSKIPELIDTLFLVLQKKEVAFIHWFHHITVMLYCWHAFHTMSAPGIWFGSMNYAVHSIMYFYYFLTAIGLNNIARPMAQTITSAQILQMFMGTFITILAGYWTEQGACHVDPANYKLGLAMYVSYLILFISLFLKKYSKKPETGKKHTICGVDYKTDDTAGMFHGRNEGEAKAKKSE
eukprot:m.144232 g.144232  ORF g.144232 m.144232 type:complete len:297 (-) comp16762_c0_seq3:605-1495(-)